MEGESRDYYETKIKDLIRELEEEINTLEFKIEEADWESDMDYKKPIAELRLDLEEAKKSVSETAVSSDAAWQVRFEQSENSLKEIGNRLKDIQTRLRGFLLE
jgi:hypothetical protein